MSIRKIMSAAACLSSLFAFGVITAPIARAGSRVGFTSDSFCGTVRNNAWKRQYESDGTPQNVYANVFGSRVQSRPVVCLSHVKSHGSGFTVSGSTVSGGYGAYPNIGQGDEWSVRPSGTWQPVRASADGDPVTSVVTDSLSVTAGIFNSAYDIWLNKTDNPTVGQNDGAEIMIWLDCHHNCIGYRPVTIDGIKWLWIYRHPVNRNTGVSWNYFTFVAVHHRDSVSGLRLNPFIRFAETQGAVSPSWYLTGIDYGFELFTGGTGLKITGYSLTGVGTPVYKTVPPKIGMHSKSVKRKVHITCRSEPRGTAYVCPASWRACGCPAYRV